MLQQFPLLVPQAATPESLSVHSNEVKREGLCADCEKESDRNMVFILRVRR